MLTIKMVEAKLKTITALLIIGGFAQFTAL